MKPMVSAPLLLLFLLTFGLTTYANTSLETLAQKAVSQDVKEAEAAVSRLRASGPAGLDALFRVHANQIARQASDPLLAPTAEWKRLSAALDGVSQQKDSYLSGLLLVYRFCRRKNSSTCYRQTDSVVALAGQVERRV